MSRDRRAAPQQSPNFVWEALDSQARSPAPVSGAVPARDGADVAPGVEEAERESRNRRLPRGASGRALIAAAVLVPLAGGTYAIVAYSGQHEDTTAAAARVSQMPGVGTGTSAGSSPTDGSGPGSGSSGKPGPSPSSTLGSGAGSTLKQSPFPSANTANANGLKASGTAQTPSRTLTAGPTTPDLGVAASPAAPTVAASTHSATPAPGPATGQIVGYEGLCLDDRGASVTNYNPVQVFTCNGTDAQQWTLESNDTVEVFGMCLDVYAAGTAGGTRVDLYQCNGTNAQTWVPQTDGALVNPESGQCLDDTEFGSSGTQVEIWTCNGGSDQVWRLP